MQSFLPILFKTAYGSFESAMYVRNTTGNPANVTITFRDALRAVNCIVKETLPAFASKGYWLTNVCKP